MTTPATTSTEATKATEPEMTTKYVSELREDVVHRHATAEATASL